MKRCCWSFCCLFLVLWGFNGFWLLGCVCLCVSVVVFFFSSRRRHTRWPRDWSSDVCSSDLRPEYEKHDGRRRQNEERDGEYPNGLGNELRGAAIEQTSDAAGHAVQSVAVLARSEERRVGKECRSRWSRGP